MTALKDDTVVKWKQDCPDWNGKHWAMVNGDGKGTLLVPANVVADHLGAADREETR
ncbi:hypothetical protein ACFWPH_28295 [Nocardia sp. NPDC058499]|uniref:hypothetical protein n=1 Tax=Nocardia sp. NPDC058499 TaxID=3346530 RepID=UPI003658A9F6